MNDKCKYCDYVSKCSKKCEYDSILCKIQRSFPKVVDKSYEQLQQENKQLKDNWNKLKKYMIDTEQIYKKSDDKYIKDMHEIGIRHAYQTILYKMYVLEQGSDSNGQ